MQAGIDVVTDLTLLAPAVPCHLGKARKARCTRRGSRPVSRAQTAENVEAFTEPPPSLFSAEDEVVLDKLIAVFEGRPTKEWRKLIAHSRQWPVLAEKVFER